MRKLKDEEERDAEESETEGRTIGMRNERSASDSLFDESTRRE